MLPDDWMGYVLGSYDLADAWREEELEYLLADSKSETDKAALRRLLAEAQNKRKDRDLRRLAGWQRMVRDGEVGHDTGQSL